MRNPVIRTLLIVINSFVLLFLYLHKDGLPKSLICIVSGICMLIILITVFVRGQDRIAEVKVEKRIKKRFQ